MMPYRSISRLFFNLAEWHSKIIKLRQTQDIIGHRIMDKVVKTTALMKVTDQNMERGNLLNTFPYISSFIEGSG
ncbi:hypothetical protein VNO77_18426 [Canavalia gladiata]|uniref:Uncharacterized protein n=1 Tax=Canavalia gladiata TaxID=3824 RepID=A0AAN9LP92_CANGL